VVFTKGKKKNTAYLLSGVKNPSKIDKVELQGLEEEKWMTVVVRTKLDKLDVLFNKKALFKDYVLDGLKDAQGTMAMGLNNLTGFFTGMSLRVLNPPKPPGPKPIIKMKEDKDEQDGEGEPSGFDIDEDEGEVEEDNNTAIEEVKEWKCLKNTDLATRGGYCEDLFGGKNNNSDQCTKNFCNICCSNESTQTLSCNAACDANTVKAELSQADLD